MRTSTAERLLRHTCGALFWLYVLTKLFVFDLDQLAIQSYAPRFMWVLQYKFFIFLGAFAIALMIVRGRTLLIFCFFVALYPAILLLWIFPKHVYRRQSWIIVFGATTLIAAFFNSFKKNIIFAALISLSSLAIFVSENTYVLLLTGAILALCLIYIYVRTVRAAFKKSGIAAVLQALPDVRIKIIAQATLDDELKAGPLVALNIEQKKKWLSKLDVPVAMNRIFLFTAKQFREYQRSPAPFVIAVSSIFVLFFFTLFVFSQLSFALFKSIPSEFEVAGAPSFFTFVWYSFNAFGSSFVKEITPIGTAGQTLWMANVMFSLFLLTILVTLYFSIKNARNSEDIDLAVSAMEQESTELESFIKSEYQLASVDAAVAELATAEASLSKVFLWLTSRLR